MRVLRNVTDAQFEQMSLAIGQIALLKALLVESEKKEESNNSGKMMYYFKMQ